ncbi:MAG: cysteine desulfurase [Actinomycetia bacterium]|nr:cysteine desulfurase [Actinomycetes bacterium]
MTDIYLDHAATTTPRPTALAAMRRAAETMHGNASGIHGAARRARNALEEAREQAADLIGATRPGEIVFTSGGTESDNLAIIGAALASPRRRVVVSAIEHKAVLESAQSLERFGFSVTTIPVDPRGVVVPESVSALVDSDVAVVSIMAANNEVGTIQPIAEIVEIVKGADPDISFHTDAVQFFVGRGLDVAALGVDLASLAAHKFGGPTGIGLLYVASGTKLEPVLVGGGQEAGRRPGTSNVAGAVGMVAAMREVVAERARFDERTGTERDSFEATLRLADPSISVTTRGADRLVHFSHIRVPGVSGETLLIRLDQVGVFAAAGSSCQSGAVEPSHVLSAVGIGDDAAREYLRFTFGWDTEPGTGFRAAQAVLATVAELR